MNDQAGKPGKKKRRRGKRAGSKKRHKTKQLQIHREEGVAPLQPLPAGSRFKGYRDFVVQELRIEGKRFGNDMIDRREDALSASGSGSATG